MRRLSLCLALLVFAGCGPDGIDAGGTGGGTAAGGGSGVGGTFDAGACTDSWASFGSSFFGGYCSGCHSAYGVHSTVEASASGLASVISSGAMPRGCGVSSTDRARAVAYLRCGAP